MGLTNSKYDGGTAAALVGRLETGKAKVIATNRNTEQQHGFRRGVRRAGASQRRDIERLHEPAVEKDKRDEQTGDLESLKLFFQQAAKYPLLTAAEEIELAKRIERGDLDAKDRMITSNLRLVIHVARGYRGQGLPFHDLIQEGIVGLIRAAEKFDWRKGFKFSTYATLWIRQAIQRGLANTGRAIRLPAHVGQRERKVARAERDLTTRLGREPTLEELAEAVELEVDEVADVRTLSDVVASLDQPLSDGAETSMGDLMASEVASPEEQAIDESVSSEIESALSALGDREREVVELRYGLRGGAALSLRDAGKALGISPERTRQIEEQALRRLAENDSLSALRDAA
jgi:RNA polymerase primary sigma factor